MADSISAMSDEEKAELHKAILKALMNKPSYNPATGQGGITGTPASPQAIKGYAENMGMSGAPASQFPGVSSLFSPKGSTYQGEGASGRQGGYPSPTLGKPSLDAVAGPLDVSPSGVAGEVGAAFADPRMYTGAGELKGANKLMGGFIGGTEDVAAKALMTPEEYMASRPMLPPEVSGPAFYGIKPEMVDDMSANQKLNRENINNATPSEDEKTVPNFSNLNALLKKK